MKILIVFGTRPEAVKMCPLVLEMKKHKEIQCVVCLTGQHREMLQQVMECFSINEDYNLQIMKENQTLTGITTSILEGLEPILQEERPDMVLVHGDTTTSFAAALACFYQKIPVGHVEAGLRTGNMYSPYPEEMNRSITAQLASYHFAPTVLNKENLSKENIKDNVYVTGNTVIDSFATTVQVGYHYHNPELQNLDKQEKKIILVTAHRRENLGEPLKNICRALKRIVEAEKNVIIVYPVHMNPRVRETVEECISHHERIVLTEPLDVPDMHNLMAESYLVLTDSGGLQEEAPALGKPVLVMRTETERPEAVKAGTAKLVGTEEMEIYREVMVLLSDRFAYERMAKAVNPYGDGHASERIVQIILGKKQK